MKMRRFFNLCLFCIFFALTQPSSHAEEVFSGATQIPPAVMRAYNKSYGVIELKLPTEEGIKLFHMGAGSGFLIDKKARLVITANHLAHRAGFERVEKPALIFFNGIPLEYVVSLPAADLVLFRAKSIPKEMEEVSLGSALLGESVYSLARTAFNLMTFMDSDKVEKSMLFFGELPFRGSVIGVTEVFLVDTPTNYPGKGTDLDYIVLNQLPRTGFSGAPAFNNNGEVVGVISGAEGGFSYLSSTKNIRALLLKYEQMNIQK